ncbi:uncharacterized protein DKFZp434B061-like [Pithys albifrons albifrons]|uniref:uncharacterized protein DKFZp434B061-like n=1 Tax=Pithys albifrons albifrons TaxID=3385563 RepID=UPI003A5CF76D
MTEKSARNPTPGSFPHTGSAPAAPPVRGQRGATSAERGAEPRGRGAAAEAPADLRGGGGPGRGERRGELGCGRFTADPGERIAVGRAPPAAPRTTADNRAAPTGRPPGARPGGELRAAARPRAATSRAAKAEPFIASRRITPRRGGSPMDTSPAASRVPVWAWRQPCPLEDRSLPLGTTARPPARAPRPAVTPQRASSAE